MSLTFNLVDAFTDHFAAMTPILDIHPDVIRRVNTALAELQMHAVGTTLFENGENADAMEMVHHYALGENAIWDRTHKETTMGEARRKFAGMAAAYHAEVDQYDKDMAYISEYHPKEPIMVHAQTIQDPEDDCPTCHDTNDYVPPKAPTHDKLQEMLEELHGLYAVDWDSDLEPDGGAARREWEAGRINFLEGEIKEYQSLLGLPVGIDL
jgi:cytochrome c556